MLEVVFLSEKDLDFLNKMLQQELKNSLYNVSEWRFSSMYPLLVMFSSWTVANVDMALIPIVYTPLT